MPKLVLPHCAVACAKAASNAARELMFKDPRTINMTLEKTGCALNVSLFNSCHQLKSD